jgi:hypothetical protein
LTTVLDLLRFARGDTPDKQRTKGAAVYFCEPTLRTQLHMSVCGPKAK